MFGQVQMIIMAVVATVVIGMGTTIYFQGRSLDSVKKELLVEQVNVATARADLESTEKEIMRVLVLLAETNAEMTNIRRDRDNAKTVLQDSSRLARLAKAKSGRISALAVSATKRVFDKFEHLSKIAAEPLFRSPSSGHSDP